MGGITHNRAKDIVRPVHHTTTEGGKATGGNIHALFAFDGRKGNGIIFQITHFPLGKIKTNIPTPHILSHRAVQLRRCAVLETVVVRGIQLAPGTVILNEVTTKSQQLWQLAEHIEAAVITGSPVRGIRFIPITSTNGVCGGGNRLGQIHNFGLSVRVQHLDAHIAHAAGGSIEFADLLSGFKSRKHR